MRCDVHTDGAIAFAALTREAEVQRLLHILIAPAVGDGRALQHLPKQMSPAARAMDFLASGHVAGAHRLVLARVWAFPAALSDANAAQRRPRKTAIVVGE